MCYCSNKFMYYRVVIYVTIVVICITEEYRRITNSCDAKFKLQCTRMHYVLIFMQFSSKKFYYPHVRLHVCLSSSVKTVLALLLSLPPACVMCLVTSVLAKAVGACSPISLLGGGKVGNSCEN